MRGKIGVTSPPNRHELHFAYDRTLVSFPGVFRGGEPRGEAVSNRRGPVAPPRGERCSMFGSGSATRRRVAVVFRHVVGEGCRKR